MKVKEDEELQSKDKEEATKLKNEIIDFSRQVNINIDN